MGLLTPNEKLPYPESGDQYALTDDFQKFALSVDSSLAQKAVASDVAAKYFAKDSYHFPTPVPLKSTTTVGSGGTSSATKLTVAQNGVYTRFTRPAISDPNVAWENNIANFSLGTVGSLQGKTLAYYISDTNSGQPIGILGFSTVEGATPNLALDQSGSVTIVTAKGKWVLVPDVYNRMAAKGYADSATVFFIAGANTQTTSIPAIDWNIAAIIVDNAAASGSYVRADELAGFNAALASTLANPTQFVYPLGVSSFTTYGTNSGTKMVPSRDGVFTIWTRPGVVNPDATLDQNLIVYRIGTVADTVGKNFAYFVDDTNSALKFFRVGAYRNEAWPEVATDPSETTFAPTTIGQWNVVTDIYSRAKEKGYVDTDPLFFCVGGVAADAKNVGSINWRTAAVLYNPAAAPTAYIRATEIAGLETDKIAVLPDIDGKARSIVCWGDSLTEQGGWTDQIASLAGVPVYNAGTYAETVRTIVSRQGADPMVINGVTIPADTSPVVIGRFTDGGIPTLFGNRANPLLKGGSTHVNPVCLAGVRGTMTYDSTTQSWSFARLVPGAAVVIDRPAMITTAYDRDRRSSLQIIFMGQNGGYTDTADIVRMHRLMKDHHKGGRTIILGLATGTAATRAEYEAAMTAEFGRYFIPLRPYLAQYGMSDVGITPTQADLDQMAQGAMPAPLTQDGVHFTPATRTAIGNMLYKRLRELGLV